MIRRSIGGSLALGALLALSIPALTRPAYGAEGLTDGGYEMAKVADGVYAFITPEPKTSLVSGNTVAVIGDNGVLLFDTGHFPSVTRRILADLRKLTDQPVRYVVNSHWHYDHVMGNAVVADEFPGVQIIVHAFTADQMEKKVPGYGETLAVQLPLYTQKLEEMLAKATSADGKPMSAGDRRRNEDLLQDCRAAMPEIRLMRYRPPDLTFEEGIDVHLGKRLVRVLHLGRGNTGGDAMISVPDAKVIATGDALVSPIPYDYDGYPTEWIKVLKAVGSMDAATIIPGHGPVMHDRKYLERVIALLESIQDQVRTAYHAGATLEEVRKKVDLAAFRREFAGDDPQRNFVFTDAIEGPGVERAFEDIQYSTE